MNGASTARTIRRLWLVVIAVVSISMLYLAKILFLPLAIAVLFAFLLAPPVSMLERVHVPRQLASAVVIIGFGTLLGFAGWALFSQLVDVVNDLPTYRDNITQKMAALHVPNDSAFGRAMQEVEHLSDQLGIGENATTQNARAANRKPLGATPDRPVQVKEVTRNTHRLDQLTGVMEPLTIALLAVVFTFFVLLQREDLRNRVIHLSGDRNMSMITQAMDDAGRRISRYFSLQLTVNVVYTLLIATALFLIGLPHPFLFGAIAGTLRFVPYVGAPVAGAMPTLLALAVFPQWSKPLYVIGLFVVLEVITANYAEPHIYGRHTGLSPLAILMAASFWTLLWGPVGLLLSVPLTVCLVAMGRHLPSLEFLTVLLGDQPVIPPWSRFYERLLAGDEREASEIFETFLEGKPLADAFDTVLVPALIASERDRLHGDLGEESVRLIRHSVRAMIEDNSDRSGTAPDGRGSFFLCIPMRDETDELAALMLAYALRDAGFHADASRVQRADALLAEIAQRPADIAALVGLPPVGLARPRRLYSSLRAHRPQLRLMIGIWNCPEDAVEIARQISGGEEASVFTSIARAVAEFRTPSAIAAAALESTPRSTAA